MATELNTNTGTNTNLKKTQVAVSTEDGEVGILDTKLTKTTTQVVGAAVLGTLAGLIAADTLNVDFIRKQSKQDPAVAKALEEANASIAKVKEAADVVAFGNVDKSSTAVGDLISYINTAEAKVAELNNRVAELTAARDQAVSDKAAEIQKYDERYQEVQRNLAAMRESLARFEGEANQAKAAKAEADKTIKLAERAIYDLESRSARTVNGSLRFKGLHDVINHTSMALDDVRNYTLGIMTSNQSVEDVYENIVGKLNEQIVASNRKVKGITFKFHDNGEYSSIVTLEDNTAVTVPGPVAMAIYVFHQGAFRIPTGVSEQVGNVKFDGDKGSHEIVVQRSHILNDNRELTKTTSATRGLFWAYTSGIIHGLTHFERVPVTANAILEQIVQHHNDPLEFLALFAASSYTFEATTPVDVRAGLEQIKQDVVEAKKLSFDRDLQLIPASRISNVVSTYVHTMSREEADALMPGEDRL